jgi:hypothetical protein
MAGLKRRRSEAVRLAEAAGAGMRIFLQPFSWVQDLLTGDRNSVIKVAIKFKKQGRSRRRRIRVNLAGIS